MYIDVLDFGLLLASSYTGFEKLSVSYPYCARTPFYNTHVKKVVNQEGFAIHCNLKRLSALYHFKLSLTAFFGV